MSLRICYPAGPLIECRKTASGSTEVMSSQNKGLHTAEVDLQSSIVNSTEVTCVPSIADCIKLMQQNESDYAIGEYLYYPENDIYSVPVPWNPGSVYIVSGYDISAFEKQSVDESPDVMNNMSLLSSGVYTGIIIFIFALFVMIMLKANLLSQINLLATGRLYRNNNLPFLGRRLFLELFNSSSRYTKLYSLLIATSFFLVSTPYLLMFKTAQVVMKQPAAPWSYEKLINMNATIYYSNMMADEVALIRPSERHVALKDITYQFWQHFEARGRFYDMAATAKSRSFASFRNLAHDIAASRAIYLSSYSIAVRIRQVFCSFSNEHQLFNIFMTKDANQREELNGFAVRNGFIDDKLSKRFRRIVEFHYIKHMRDSFKNYFLLQVLGTSDQHQRTQLQICEQQKITQKQVEFKASEVVFFINFCILLSGLLALSFVILIIEILMARGVARKAGNKKKLRNHRTVPLNIE